MNEPVRAIVKCQDPGDGSGDIIIDLPSEILEGMNVSLGDLLSIERIEGTLVLKVIRDIKEE